MNDVMWRLLIYSQARSRYEHARNEFFEKHGVTVQPWNELEPERRANWVRDTQQRAGK